MANMFDADAEARERIEDEQRPNLRSRSGGDTPRPPPKGPDTRSTQSPDPRYTLPMTDTEQRIRSENPNAPPQDLPYDRGGPRGSRPGKPEPLKNPPPEPPPTQAIQFHGASSAPPSPQLTGPSQDTDPRPPIQIHGAASAPPSPQLNARHPGFPTAEQLRQTQAERQAPPPGSNAGTERSTDEDIHPASGAQPVEPSIKPHEDEANFTPGPLPKRPGVTPPGKGGGGGGGTTGPGGKRLALGDQRRTAAYDPTLDKADPRNVAMVDDKYRVNPRQWERAQKGAIDPTKPGERTGEKAAAYTNHYTNALAGATAYMEDLFHQKKGDPAKGEGYVAMTFKGVGAPDPQIVDSVFKVVDPQNQLEPKERMELATRAMHDWYVSKGDQKSADKVAAEMLQHGNKQAQVLGKQAMEAIKGGNQQAAIDAIAKAYDWLPDGFHSDVVGNKLTITNDQGKVVNQIPLDPAMIKNLSTGLATGTLYWDIVQQRAGKPGTFAPPEQQPQQAITPAAPTSGATAAPRPAGPPGAPQAGPTPGAPPAAPVAPGGAPPTAPAVAGPPAGAPPPAPPPGVSAPPASRTPVPPPVAAPASPASRPPVPPPPVTPPGSRPAAPAPAAPGPAPTQQAAIPLPKPEIAGPQYNVPPEGTATTPAPPPPPQGSGGPPSSPAGDQPKPALETKVPPKLQGPVQPSTTKRPIVADEPEKSTSAREVPKDKEATVTKTDVTDEAKAQKRFVYDPDDPDSVPIDRATGKPAVFRRNTEDNSPAVKEAKQKIREADAKKQADLDWLAYKEKTGKGTTGYAKVIADFRRDIEDTHKTAVARYSDVVKEGRQDQKDRDKAEKDELKPTYHRDSELVKAETRINEKIKAFSEDTSKGSSLKNSPIRLMTGEDGGFDEKKAAPMRDVILEIHAHNRTGNNSVPLDKITEAVITMTQHLGSDKAGKAQTANEGQGAQASRHRVVAKDLNGNPVVMVGTGNKALVLHMPPSALNEIKRLKEESYKDEDKKLKEDQKKYEQRTRLKEGAAKLFGIKNKVPLVSPVIDWAIGDKPKEKL